MTRFADRFQVLFPKSTWGNRFGIHDIINGHDVYGPQGHRGTDYKVGVGTPVPAMGNGEVALVGHSVALGNIVVVRHYLPGPNNDVYSGIAHLSTPLVTEGQQVSLGMHIARSGETGTACYGPHVHHTVSNAENGIISGEVVDPIEFIDTFNKHVIAAPTNFQVKTTVAKRGEGLIAIAKRSGISFDRIRQLNPKITGPEYLVLLGQKIRIA